MIVKLLTEHHLEFLSLTGDRGGWSESTLVKMSNCWKSQSTAHFLEIRGAIIICSIRILRLTFVESHPQNPDFLG